MLLIQGFVMKKIVSVLIIFILFLSGMGSAALLHQYSEKELRVQSDTFTFPAVSVTKKSDEYVTVELDETCVNLLESGRPILPKKIIYYELPFGATDITVQLEPGEIDESRISGEVKPAPAVLPLNGITEGHSSGIKDQSVYESDLLYPNQWFSSNVVCGLNENDEHVTMVSVHLYPVRYQPLDQKVYSLESATIKLSYDEPKESVFVNENEYDLVIIAPAKFSDELTILVDHKNDVGINTFLKTTEDIFDEYTGRDNPEQIKYFIKDSIESLGISYVLLVGGLNSMIKASTRDDTNQGSTDWYVPVRYTNLDVGSYDDPGFISDLYYADIYKEGGLFEDWDSNGNNIFSEWTSMRKDEMDLSPDVYVGRLACRNENEVNILVNKIITYENKKASESWFNKIIAIAGDAFQDQEDLDIMWDTRKVSDGTYTIHAQSTNPESVLGPIDEVTVTLDKTQESVITFTEDDHLKTDSYPFAPIAEITSPSEGNILGNSDVDFTPPEAYSGYYWANVTYLNEVMHIRGKSYDPQPYGYVTDIKVWITNSDEEIVFVDWRNDTETYYEDEWSTGNKMVDGRGGSLYYLPDSFEKILLWTSNGAWNEQADVINTFSKGSGFVHLSGHASPRTWGDQYPGIPGGRRYASVSGLMSFNPFGLPMFPMSKLSNGEKLPVVVACGCHNGQFNVTILETLSGNPYMWTYGVPIPECWSWWLTRLENGGSIATISNTGMGYGMQGKYCISGGLNPWLDTEFFRLYGQENKMMLGEAYEQAIGNYVRSFDMDDSYDGIGHVKSVQQWTLLGDPSLKIGGYD